MEQLFDDSDLMTHVVPSMGTVQENRKGNVGIQIFLTEFLIFFLSCLIHNMKLSACNIKTIFTCGTQV